MLKEYNRNPLMYIFNQDILETVFLALNHIIGIKEEPINRWQKKFLGIYN